MPPQSEAPEGYVGDTGDTTCLRRTKTEGQQLERAKIILPPTARRPQLSQACLPKLSSERVWPWKPLPAASSATRF